MARGFLTGTLLGVVVASAGAGGLSLAVGIDEQSLTKADPMPAMDVPKAGGDATPKTSDAKALADDPAKADAVDPASDAPKDVVVAVDAPKVDPVKPVAVAADKPADLADTSEKTDATAIVPELALASAQPDATEGLAPARTDPAKAAVTASDSPDAVPVDAGDAKPGRRPAPELGVDLAETPKTDLDAPAAPVAVGAQTAPLAAPQIGAAPDALTNSAPVPGAGAGVQVATDAPVLAGVPGAALSAPVPDAQLSISTLPAQPPVPKIPGASSALVPDASIDLPDPVQAQDPGSDTAIISRPAIGKPAGSLLNRDTGVTTGRLPNLAASGDAPADAVAVTKDSAVFKFAVPSTAAADVPRLSIVLVDDGSGPLGPEALEAFPFPVSFAISTSHPRAAEAAKAYRELGFEVTVLADVPEGATATDVEVTLAAALDAVPEVVAVVEGPSGGIQGSREAASQAANVLAASGHGLVMMPKGLNTAQGLAARAGVPATTLFRDFDGEGQDASVIRRTLDQAAFRARQEGAVVMLGRLRADTISALVLWGLQDRGSSIALVPVSLVLQETLNQ